MENELFYLDEFIVNKNKEKKDKKEKVIILSFNEKMQDFNIICEDIETHFKSVWQSENNGSEASDKLLETQKRAIMGHSTEVKYFKSKIEDYLKNNNLINEWYPEYYDDLVSAIFNELWGFSILYQWITKYDDSSSAKIIGSRVYFMIDGALKLQEQRLSEGRLVQLKKALLLNTPEIRLGAVKYAQVYLVDGTRVTIYDTGLAKEPTIVFRKYIVPLFTFEEQASRGTIPYEVIPMFKSMIEIGYNINFIGPVRSAKTTMLETWQSYEDPNLEGIMVETDPEIPMHKLMPNAPIIQLVADGEDLKRITKMLMRGDADYLIMAEARDATAVRIAVEVANKGTKRVKSTYHTSDPTDFPYDAASLIVSEFGGDLFTTTTKVAKSYHYLFEMTYLRNRGKKRMKSMIEIRCDNTTGEISFHRIIKYNPLKDNWQFKYDIGKDKEDIALYESPKAFETFKRELKKLEELSPMEGNHVIKPIYGKILRGSI